MTDSEVQGYLYKRGEGGLQLYKRRYFVLRDNDLYYSVDNSLPALLNPLGKIDLTRVSKVACLVDVGSLFGPNVHYVYLYTPHRTYDLYAESKVEAQNWAKHIETIVAQHATTAASHETPISENLPVIMRSGCDVLFENDTDDIDEMPPPPPRAASAASTSATSTSSNTSTNNNNTSNSSSSSKATPIVAAAAVVVEYLAVPVELRRMFKFTENYGYAEYCRLIEPAIEAAVNHANRALPPAPSAAAIRAVGETSALFAGCLLIRALGADLLQYNDAAPSLTVPISDDVIRQYAALHELLLGRLQTLDQRLAQQTASLDRWIVANRQQQLFASATRSTLPSLNLPTFDRIGVLRWHVLLLCDFATRHWETLRASLVAPKRYSDDNDVSLTRVLYAWDVTVDGIMRELSRLPVAVCGVHLWQLLIDSDAYVRDCGIANTSDKENPYQMQLNEARKSAGIQIAAALGTRLPKCSANVRDETRRLLHADLLLRQIIDELDELQFNATFRKAMNAICAAHATLANTLDSLIPLQPYRQTIRELRNNLINAWHRSIKANGASSTLLERTVLDFGSSSSSSSSSSSPVPTTSSSTVTSVSSPTLLKTNSLSTLSNSRQTIRIDASTVFDARWLPVLIRLAALLKRTAALVDHLQFADIADSILLAAVESNALLPPLRVEVASLGRVI